MVRAEAERPSVEVTVSDEVPALPARPGIRQTFAAFHYHDYRILWMSMAASFTAMQMQMVARGWLAYEISGSHSAVGVVMVAWGIPQLLFSLIGGAVADRMDKRQLLFMTQAAVGATALATAVAISAGAISIPFLFVVGLIQGGVFAFNLPARQALIPELVPRSGLMNAIALNNAAMNGTRIIAPALAGVIMATVGVAEVFYLQAILNFAVVGILTQLPQSKSHLAGATRRGTVFHEIGVGLRYIWASKLLRLLMVLAFVPAVFGMPYMTLLPGFASDDLEIGKSAYGFMLAASGVGALVGSIAIAATSGNSRMPLTQAVAGLGFGASLAAVGLVSVALGYPGAIISLVFLGLCSTSYMTLNNTMIMANSRPEFHGRVMSVYMITFSIFPLMAWPLGLVADATSAVATFVLLGCIIAGFIVLTAVSNPRHVFGRREAGGGAAAPGEPAAVGVSAGD